MDSTVFITGIVTVLVALIGGLPATIIAYAVFRKTDKVEAKANALITTTNSIQTLANGHLTKMTAALELANSKVEGLERLLTSHTNDWMAAINKEGKT